MSVEVKYIVKRNGVEVMSLTNQKEANAYDKMLDLSDELRLYLEDKINDVMGEKCSEKKLEDLCIFIAKNKDEFSRLLKGQKLNQNKE